MAGKVCGRVNHHPFDSKLCAGFRAPKTKQLTPIKEVEDTLEWLRANPEDEASARDLWNALMRLKEQQRPDGPVLGR